MKLVISLLIGISLLFGIVNPFGRNGEVLADQYYISYGEVTWAEEKVYFRNFAIELRSDPDMLAYVGLFARKDEKPSEVRRRKKRILRFLVNELKIAPKRIVIRSLGKKEKRFTILQPTRTDADPPF